MKIKNLIAFLKTLDGEKTFEWQGEYTEETPEFVMDYNNGVVMFGFEPKNHDLSHPAFKSLEGFKND